MEKIIWRVEYTSLPRVKKYCKKCGEKSEFLSSKLFRVNANQKNLDNWLIYKCLDCKTTWKEELFSRIKHNYFPKLILDKFCKNDSALAHQYTMNCNHLSKIGFEILIPNYSIIGKCIDLNIDNKDQKKIEIHLISDYQFNIKITSILKKKLEISNSQLDYLIKNDKISCDINKKIKKCKLQKEQKIYLTI